LFYSVIARSEATKQSHLNSKTTKEPYIQFIINFKTGYYRFIKERAEIIFRSASDLLKLNSYLCF
ncbi:MAG: hypothetical protein Q8880_11900, partial [Bacteroidota bacterium]|nr:hypothetical protein [Bacteroidota bacterium]